MSHRTGLALSAAVVLTSLTVAAPGHAEGPAEGTAHNKGGYDCVDTSDWSRLQTDLDGPNGGARRSVVEQTWEVLPAGYRNQYWDPGNDALYSLAYNFCQNPQVLIVMVYRKSSGAWQVALKAAFLPV